MPVVHGVEETYVAALGRFADGQRHVLDLRRAVREVVPPLVEDNVLPTREHVAPALAALVELEESVGHTIELEVPVAVCVRAMRNRDDVMLVQQVPAVRSRRNAGPGRLEEKRTKCRSPTRERQRLVLADLPRQHGSKIAEEHIRVRVAPPVIPVHCLREQTAEERLQVAEFVRLRKCPGLQKKRTGT